MDNDDAEMEKAWEEFNVFFDSLGPDYHFDECPTPHPFERSVDCDCANRAAFKWIAEHAKRMRLLK